jgi:hypothetical protein
VAEETRALKARAVEEDVFCRFRLIGVAQAAEERRCGECCALCIRDSAVVRHGAEREAPQARLCAEARDGRGVHALIESGGGEACAELRRGRTGSCGSEGELVVSGTEMALGGRGKRN